MQDALFILGAVFLVLLNGFFVAAEFALVKIRLGRLDELVRKGRPFAGTARWLAKRMDAALSACQLGITMASLGLGWVGEPAFARMITPLLNAVGVTSAAAQHTISFIIAFTLITALHLVIGEQAPKIFAIRRPETMLLWCAAPMKFFYVLLYPFLMVLKVVTEALLRRVGITGGAEHEATLSEDEIRAALSRAHAVGELSRSEHRMLHAVFEFDDLVTRRVMVPRSEVVFLDLNADLGASLVLARETKHTRYPVCDGSLDRVVGIAHIKDLVGVSAEQGFDLSSILRPPRHVPESMPISRLLKHFQLTHELMALVVDEHGTLAGIVSLENVLEEIVGPVEDEFDDEIPDVVDSGGGRFIIRGGAPLDMVNRRTGLDLHASDVDTISGFLVAREGRLLVADEEVLLEGATAKILEADGVRALRVEITVAQDEPGAAEGAKSVKQ
jgi:magnesium and cobalt exporter, CNNM family